MKRGTGKAQCICPAHADREASLTLTDGNDRVLIKCHAGCSTEEVVIAAGLKMSDLFYGDGLAKERWRAYIENREKEKSRLCTITLPLMVIMLIRRSDWKARKCFLES